MKKETGTKAKRGKSRAKTVFQRKPSLLIMEQDAVRRRRRTHKLTEAPRRFEEASNFGGGIISIIRNIIILKFH